MASLYGQPVKLGAFVIGGSGVTVEVGDVTGEGTGFQRHPLSFMHLEYVPSPFWTVTPCWVELQYCPLVAALATAMTIKEMPTATIIARINCRLTLILSSCDGLLLH